MCDGTGISFGMSGGDLEISVSGVVVKTTMAADIANASGPHSITVVGDADDVVTVNDLGAGIFEDLNVNSAATVTVASAITLNNDVFLTSDAINLNADVSSANGNQNYTGPVNLGADLMLTGMSVDFSSTIDGAQALTINATVQNQIVGVIGGTTALTSFTTDSSGATLIGADVTTTGDQTYSDALALTGSATFTAEDIFLFNTVNFGANDLNLNVSGTDSVATGVISGTGSLTKSGDGDLLITSANTYSGGTTFDAGGVRIENDTAFGTGTVTISDTGEDPILDVAGGLTIANDFTISDVGDNKQIDVNDAGANAVTFTGNFTINETELNNFDIVTGDQDSVTISGDISGAGSITVLSNGNSADVGTLILSGNNVHAGTILESSGTTVRAESDTALGGNLTFNRGSTVLEHTFRTSKDA